MSTFFTSTAYAHLVQQAEAGNVSGQYQLGEVYLKLAKENPQSKTRYQALAEAYLYDASEQGLAIAAATLAKLYIRQARELPETADNKTFQRYLDKAQAEYCKGAKANALTQYASTRQHAG